MDPAHHLVPVLLRRKNEELQSQRQPLLPDSHAGTARDVRRLEDVPRVQIVCILHRALPKKALPRTRQNKKAVTKDKSAS